MQEEFKIFSTVYYVGPKVIGRDHPEFGESCMVDRISDNSLTVSNTHFILEISKELLSKTPPDKEKSEFPFMYYIGDDADEMKYIKFGERVEIIPTHEKYRGNQAHPGYFLVRTISGVTILVNRLNVSTDPPVKEKSSADLLSEIRAGIDERLKASGGDKDAISSISIEGINSNSLFNSEELKSYEYH